jgi:FlaA1/EpsC-like NDP-sugar epimerase
MMPSRLKRPVSLRSSATVLLHDLLMIPVAWFAAYFLRFNLGAIPEPYLARAWWLLPFVAAIQGASFWYFGLYRGVWRFASMPDLVRIVKAVTAGVTGALFFALAATRLESVPRSVFVLDALLLVALLGGPRFLYRLAKDRHLYLGEGKRAVIVGAGHAGELLVRDMLREAGRAFQPVAFVDDTRRRIGMELHGVRVMGRIADIQDVVNKVEADLILIAIPSAGTRQMQRIVSQCEATGLPMRILPRIQDLVSGQASVTQLREVRLDDLLGREPVALDWKAISAGLRGKTALVTGGGGSIGSELCRQVARLGPARLIVFEQSEFNLYTIENELRRDFPAVPFTGVLGDVSDAIAVEAVMQREKPEIVFHAAAYKHVPMLESQARAAVINNVLGTRTVASAAMRAGCGTFVLISTDKAVNPANVMGATKRAAEIVCQGMNGRGPTRFVTVRFGNVLGSAGSVIPLFQQQIAAGGPVTVTHPDIERFFMTIPEAAQLILQASVIGEGGEIFVLDMGEPVKIGYLAEQMIRLSGKKPHEDIAVEYTGLRPGEKLYEELFHEQEPPVETRHPKIRLARSRSLDVAMISDAIDDLSGACDSNDEPRLRAALARLVPEHALAKPPSAVVYPFQRNA